MDILSAKFLFLVVVALVVLGPDRLPAALRSGGRLLAEFRRLADAAQVHGHSLLDHAGLVEPLDELASLGRAVTEPVRSLRSELDASWPPDPGGVQRQAQSVSSVATSPSLPCSDGFSGAPVEDPQDQLELVWP